MPEPARTSSPAMDRSNILDTSSSMGGLFLSATVFIILTMQVWLYFRKNATRDARWIKGIAVSVWIIQAVQIAMSSHMASLSMRGYDNDVQTATAISVDWAIYVGTTSLTTFLVHVLFVRRLYILGKCLKSRLNPAIPAGLVTTTAQGQSMHPTVISSHAHAMGTSHSFWVVLCNTNVSRALLKRLTIFVVQTGLIASIVAMVTVGIWAAACFDTRHLFMSFPMGGLYATYIDTGGRISADKEDSRSIEFTPWESAPSNSPGDADVGPPSVECAGY
ncbi:hypothetical protein BV22DRAFT_288437 [Leucogyrophana mollusca]|uniref:Uncharacterized protein n=1 Tax=Leucogyrophana mollusca TaxID=85980 RepID=A0ACB8BNS5_9AGAM|nr:hypothetical protein BV22DRAFT_288437 [Leucogyrophana mollusca]